MSCRAAADGRCDKNEEILISLLTANIHR